MTRDVWVTLSPEDGCQCWRDAVCGHGWTWQEEEPPCVHQDAYQDVHESFADAVRALYPIRGGWAIGSLLRERAPRDSDQWPTTRAVYVMPADSGPFTDDHEAEGGPAPLWIIHREPLLTRSTPRVDSGALRRMAGQYRIKGERQ